MNVNPSVSSSRCVVSPLFYSDLEVQNESKPNNSNERWEEFKMPALLLLLQCVCWGQEGL
jgi:hypothetical protein